MFSSEQKFSINGDTDEDLRVALGAALSISGYKIKSYNYVNGEVFLYYTEDAGKYSFPVPATLDLLTTLVSELLNSSDSEDYLSKVDSYDIDGSQNKGWEVYIPAGLSGQPEYAELRAGEWYIAFAVRPDWTYYHK